MIDNILNKRKFLLAFSGVLVAIALSLFSLIVIENFSSPLTGWTGIGLWQYINYDHVDVFEFPGYFLFRNLHFTPFPNVDFFNNSTLYPYGTSQFLQVWVLEAHLLYSAAYSLWGAGPWLKIYYLVSFTITGIGAFLLLHRDYGNIRAITAGIIVSFCNFYAILKFPHHFNVAVIHWTTLSFIADFLIVKKFCLGEKIRLRLLLFRLCLLFLSFGQELGYIAGFSLMSLVISFGFMFAVLVYKVIRREIHLATAIKDSLRRFTRELNEYRFQSAFLISISLAACFLYLPIVFQIYNGSKLYDFDSSLVGFAWTNPLRIFIPYFPFINSPDRTYQFQTLFQDQPEAMASGSPGWFLIAIAALGLWSARRKIIIFIPLLIIFLLCLSYHPDLQTLKVFPWFRFNRVGGRCTLLYPVILALFAIHIDLSSIRSKRRDVLTTILVVLACIEFATAYSFRSSYASPSAFPSNFNSYIDYIKTQPGEAILDWPFCIHSGNGVGICPMGGRAGGAVYALSRFHQKKVIGMHFGRLHPQQIEPFIDAGLDQVVSVDSSRDGQQRCLNEEEWSFFSDFYMYNDFAGINLHVDQLSEECVPEFYERFGGWEVETDLPEVGHTRFIPKSMEMRANVDLLKGSDLRLSSYVSSQSVSGQ